MREVIFRLLESALEDFYAQEQRNLQLNVHEICHGHRLAIYFENRIREYDDTHREKLFDNYYVDIEFNRTEGGAVKRVYYDNELHDTRCDLLLHRKGNVQPPERENLLIVELKKEHSTEREDLDIKEINRMVSPSEEGAPDAAICNTLLGIYLKIGQSCYFGTKYWYEGNRVQQDEFTRQR
jgi:hypothetical protein